MKLYTPMKLKQLKKSLEFGDVKKCADDLNVSTTTVQTALSGEGMTETHRAILDHLEYMVGQAKERKARILAAGKAEFHRQKQSNPQ